jgi:DNA (cytosine-5)-methyltransferase 1
MLVQPFILSQASGGAPRSTDKPVPAIPTDGAHALISPYYGSGSGETCSSEKEPLPTVTAKARFGMVLPITHSDGSNRARDVDASPLPTLTTANRGEQALVEGAEGYDILFRMLEPHELAAAMGFDGYEFAGNKTEKIKQIGNAVSVKKMKACVGAIMADAAPKRKAVAAPAESEAA